MDFLSKKNVDNSQISQSKGRVEKKGKILSAEQGENGVEKKGFSDKIKMLFKKDQGGYIDEKDGEKDSRDGDVNFLASDFIIPPAKEVKRKIMILISFLGLIIFAVVSIYVALAIKERISLVGFVSLTEEKDNIQKKIDSLADVRKVGEKFKKDVELANILLNQHIYWDNFFTLLENCTLTDVFYESFNADATGQLKLDLVANDFNALTEQIRVFEDAGCFSSIEVSSITLEKDTATGKINGVKCFISMNVNPEIFYKK